MDSVIEMEIAGLHAGEIVETKRHRELAKQRPQIDEDGDLVLVSRDGERKFLKDCLVTDLGGCFSSRCGNEGPLTVLLEFQ